MTLSAACDGGCLCESCQLNILECSSFYIPVPSVAHNKYYYFPSLIISVEPQVLVAFLLTLTPFLSLLFPFLFPPLENFTLSPPLGRNARDQKEEGMGRKDVDLGETE